jgi:CBS domain-containing protein
VVTRAGDPTGIFTERDVLRRVALKEIDPWQITMNEVMTSPVITMPKTAVWEKC